MRKNCLRALVAGYVDLRRRRVRGAGGSDGKPAYDFSKAMIYLGTDDGTIYGVKTPF